MRNGALSVLGCPRCLGPLRIGTGKAVTRALFCDRDGIEYPFVSDVPDLVMPERAERVDTFARGYSLSWHNLGLASIDPSEIRNLPCVPRFRRRARVWRIKAKSMNAVQGFLETLAPTRVLDLGSGVGWLAFHLARRGYETYALDVNLGGALGLGAAEVYLQTGVYFERVRGEIEFPPFQVGAFDAVICNASIHYVENLRSALLHISRILAENGVFVMMNSPVHTNGYSARRAERDMRERLRVAGATSALVEAYHHYTIDELRDAFLEAFGMIEELRWDPGWLFRAVRQGKGVFLGMQLAQFPILWAKKLHPA